MQLTTYLEVNRLGDLDFSRQPALRSWGDALLELVAERDELDITPDLSIRRKALFCWLHEPPAHRLAELVGRRRFEIEVDPSQCAIADASLADPLFQHTTWTRFLRHATELGFSQELVEEELVPVTAPAATSLVEATVGVLRDVDQSLVDALLDYVHPPCREYLESWSAFERSATAHTEPRWEVIVPESAVIGVEG